jgi:hypothetical protein
MTILETVAKELVESRIKFMEEMYSSFIQEESELRRHPIDFKNFIIWKLEEEIKNDI